MVTAADLFLRLAKTNEASPCIEHVSELGEAPQIFSCKEVASEVVQIAGALRAVPKVEFQSIVLVGGVEGKDLVVLQLALVWAGLIYTPVDLEDPRWTTIAKNCDAETLVCVDAPPLDNDDGKTLQVVLLKDLKSIPGNAEVKRPSTRDICHIFHTSGSTGAPKGVVVKHESLLAYCLGRASSGRFGKGSSRYLLASSMTFDPNFGEAMAVLVAGAVLCTASKRLLFGGHLTFLLSSMRITHTCMTPTVFSLRGTGSVDAELPNDVPSLEELALGGEPMPKHLFELATTSWRGRLRLINIYGVTEATVYQCALDCSWFDVSVEVAHQLLGQSICDGTKIGLLCTSTREITWMIPSSFGNSSASKRHCGACTHEKCSSKVEMQEIVVGGQQVAVGYLNNERKTEEKFFDANSTRIFRTGDLGSIVWVRNDLVEQGIASCCRCGQVRGPFIKLHGRNDLQVKVNGVRIEVGEIEHALMLAGDVIKFAKVIKHEQLEQLIAFVELTNDENVNWNPFSNLGSMPRYLEISFASMLKNSLPTAMRPTRLIAFRKLEELQSSSGKLDLPILRNAELPDLRPLASRVAEAKGEVDTASESLSPLELRIAELWSGRLGIPLSSIGPWDSFANIGGDSLEAQRFVHDFLKLVRAETESEEINSMLDPKQSFGKFHGVVSVPALMKAPSLRVYAKNLLEIPQITAYAVAQKSGSMELEDCSKEETKTLENRALFLAAVDDSAESIKILCQFAKCSPDAGVTRTSRGKSPLHAACAFGNQRSARALLECGANIFATTKDNAQPAHVAAGCPAPGGTKILRMIIDEMRKRNVAKPGMVRDGRQQTLIHAAARGGNVQTLKLILSEHAKDFEGDEEGRLRIVRCLDRWSRTALHWAVINGHLECVKVLLDAGCRARPYIRPSIRQKRTMLPYEDPIPMAERIGLEEIVSILKSHVDF